MFPALGGSREGQEKMPPKAKTAVAFTAAELKQWAAVLIACTGHVVRGMRKMNSAEIFQKMVEQIHI